MTEPKPTGGFRITPRPHKSIRHHVLVELQPHDYDLLSRTAKLAGVSMKEFCRQAVRHALETIEIDDK